MGSPAGAKTFDLLQYTSPYTATPIATSVKMGDHDVTPTCVTSEKHELRDHVMHYIGCLEFCERPDFYESADEATRKHINSELRRIKFLRETLQQDDEEKDLLYDTSRSFRRWRASPTYVDNIKQVQDWRKSLGRLNFVKERDVQEKDAQGKAAQGKDLFPQTANDYDPDMDINAYAIRYQNWKPVSIKQDDRYNGVFPNQKINVQQLLTKSATGKENPLTEAGKVTAGEGTFNYFHLPANNMMWVKKAMSRYYDEPDLDYDGIFREPSPAERTRAYMVLRPQYWKGQQHGGRSSIVHARHLRPICEVISSEKTILRSDLSPIIPNNLVLFSPYLHWDTDRYRDRISQVIDKEEERNRRKKEKKKTDELIARQDERGALTLPCGKSGEEMKRLWSNTQLAHVTDTKPLQPNHTFTGLLQPALTPYPKFKKYFKSDIFHRSERTGRIKAGTELGQLLLDAALLYEAMSCYRDKRLIQKYLHADPPLHPRRTLDQACYSTLKSTKWRDRDQVVYRGTRADPKLLHHIHIDPVKKKPVWDCPRKDLEMLAGVGLERPLSGEQSRAAEIAYRCPDCRDHIRKVARVVMVDQLWMWVLDEKTLITCFPKRYGVNKQDPSGVHYLVRRHLRNVREDHIRTVFDLALIVLTEVTNIFFDRAKTSDRQPQVMDIFADSIGQVQNREAIAFDNLWHWTAKLANLQYPNPFTDISALVFLLLNVNPEGKLLREIKDVLDELDIMLWVSQRQRDVIRKFTQQAERILDSAGTWRNGKSPAVPPGSGGEGKEEEKRRVDFLWFNIQAEELLCSIDSHISELEGLRASAASTSESLKSLLDLMQQQSSAIQAWQSANQSDETVKQGRAIMIFTTVTIVFLPLSFMSSVFGMNNNDFGGNDNTMTLSEQLRLMFSISIGIIVLAIVLAVGAVNPPPLLIYIQYFLTWLYIKSGVFSIKVAFAWKQRFAASKTQRSIKAMKEDVAKTRQKRLADGLEKARADFEKKLKRKGNGQPPAVSRTTSRTSGIMLQHYASAPATMMSANRSSAGVISSVLHVNERRSSTLNVSAAGNSHGQLAPSISGPRQSDASLLGGSGGGRGRGRGDPGPSLPGDMV
ncbi:hypothetical protein B0H63DRAFT_411967 [Podospora didyma]|uniref:Uncharacterized protein n=1 Tax=Podospora didyma TaxID=330526 RepID=A0AAE0NSI6_9PEZI|nr:hypothetical protein B0H63DRAFT_411967 [Podospora didyma]